MEIAKSLQRVRSSYIREILAVASDPNIISLAGGLPAEETFPLSLFKPTLERLSNMPEAFQYGATDGYAPLLNHLTHLYSLPETHKLLVTTGSQQGLDLIARAYINPGDSVVMETPSYLGAMQVFEFSQANIIPVRQTETGPDLCALQEVFEQQLPKLFYAVPDFHNPTGVCWSLETRKKVAELCRQYEVTLIEDIPYRELRFSGNNMSLVSEFCPEHSIVLRSFSKIASPGLRLGVVSGPRQYIDPLVKVKQGADLHTSVPVQALLLGLLQDLRFEEHIDLIRTLYRSRYEALLTALTEQLSDSCTTRPVDGGMFVWVTVPECDTLALAKCLLKQGVAIVPSTVFYPQSVEVPAAMRLNFTNAHPNALIEAVMRIKRVLQNGNYMNQIT